MRNTLVFCLLACCFAANAQEPTAQECLDRALVSLTSKNQNCLVYSEVLKTASEPGQVRSSSSEYIRLRSDFDRAPQELLLLKDSDGVLNVSPVLVTMLLRQMGETKYGEFVGDGDVTKLGVLPDKQDKEDPELTKHRARLDFLVADARHALLLPLFFQRVKQVAVPLILKSYDEPLVDARLTEKEIIGVWQYGVSKVEVRFSKTNSWLPTKLRWFNSKEDHRLARTNTGEIAEEPTYENEVVWQKVEDVWIPVHVRYSMTQVACGKGRSCEYVQQSMYRFKALEKFGSVDGFFEELKSGGPFQKIILEMADDLLKLQNGKR